MTSARAAALTVVLSLAWILPHLVSPRKVPDRGDPVFSAWRLARVAHQLATDPRHLFDGNIFYPRQWTLAYSDATLMQGAIATPFLWAGADPLVVANGLFLVAFPLCAAAFFLSAWRLTRDTLAATIAGLMGAWYPFHAEHYSHLELQWFMFCPLAMMLALETIERPTWRRGVLLGVVLALQCLASMYLGLMLITVLLPLGAVGLWRRRANLTATGRASAAAALVILPVVLALSIPYGKARAEHGERTMTEIVDGSAVPADYLKTPRRLASYRWHDRSANRPEHELFPGVTPLAFGAIGIATLSGGTVPLAAGALAAFDWSLGTNGLTYGLLLRGLPPYRSVRVPARFAAIGASAWILLAGYGVARLSRASGERRRRILAVVLAAAVAIDMRFTVDLVDYYPQVPAFYARVDSSSVIADLPAGREIDYMYFSTTHWGRLLTGYSGFIPQDADLVTAQREFPAAQALARLQSRGATHLSYICAFERSKPRCDYNLAELERNADLELVGSEQWQGAPARLYRFRRVPGHP